MTTAAGAPVVVGVDGSERSLLAVGLAAHMAARRARSLRIVHAFIWPELHVPLGPSPEGPPEGGLANDAKRLLMEAMAHAQKLRPDVTVTGEIVVGAPVQVLLAEAHGAAMVVLGDRGLGGFTGLLVGSVAIHVAAHAACPVVVARGEVDRGGDILVGVDGSPAGASALDFAFEEAALRGVGITALHTYIYPVAGDPGDLLPLVYDADQLKDEETAVLAEAVAGWCERYPDVPVNQALVRDRASRALVHAADRAALVVVGCRGRGGFLGLVLGSVSQALLHHASCPVAIMR
jgi:nucleotide-binding universal stress UspA family protein